MKNQVFNRKEVKYIITKDEFELLNDILKNHMTLDEHNIGGKAYTINTLYFDTADDELIRNSLMKPKYKEKVRARSYENFSEDKICFLEIKKKVNGNGNKRRTKMTLQEARKFLETGTMPKLEEYMNKQVLDELAFIVAKHKLYPKVLISYERMAYKGIADEELRVTFDREVKGIRDGKESYILDRDKIILEIKTSQGIPIWLVRLLSENKIYQKSFSKYGTEYTKHIVEKRDGGKTNGTNIKYDKYRGRTYNTDNTTCNRFSHYPWGHN